MNIKSISSSVQAKKHLSAYLVAACAIPFLFLAVFFYHYDHEIADILIVDNYAYQALRMKSIALVFKILTTYLIFLLFLAILEVLRTYQRKALQDTVLILQNQYNTLFQASSDTWWEYDIPSDTLTNSAVTNSLYKDSVIPNFHKNMLAVSSLHPDDYEAFLQYYNSLLSPGEKTESIEVRGREANGSIRWHRITGHKIYADSEIPVRIIGQSIDITDIRLAEQENAEKAMKDGLTKLHNPKSCEINIDNYFRHLDYSTIAALFLIDIDDFMNLNDKYGVVFGDAVLMDIAAKLHKFFRSKDIIGRVGNDTFLVFLTDAASVADIQNYAGDLLNLFHEMYPGGESSIELRVSIGVSLYPANGNEFQTLYRHSCQALAHAKQLGKDRYFIYDSFLDEYSTGFSDATSRLKAPVDRLAYDTNTVVNTSMIVNAIDILFNAADIDLSLQMLLSIIGAHYSLDRISIFQNDEDGKTVSISHEWVSNQRYQLKDYYKKMPIESCDRYAYYKQTENGLYYVDNLAALTEEPDAGSSLDNILFQGHETQSIFQCGINEKGIDLGSITATVFSPGYHWDMDTIDSLTLISKIIGSFLAHSRSLMDANRLTKTDALTNTYNFNTFLSEVNNYHVSHPEQPLAMLYSDIQQFKLINENFGYSSGDYILQSVANMYREMCPNGILCRISGDKFALCIPDNGEEELSNLAKRLISHCKHLRRDNGEQYKVSLVIGIYQMKEKDRAILSMDRANIARKNAGRRSLSSFAFFNDEMQASLHLQKDIEDAMEDSLLRNAFLVYFQPKYDIASKTICGAEALVRWQHPTLGFLSPNQFIPLFESNGFIMDLDYYMFEQVCIYLRNLLSRGYQPFPFSVNFSREHFQSSGLYEKLTAAVEYYHVPPQCIEIEITESVFAGTDYQVASLLEKIRNYGFRLSMDDFGSGVSSLNLLSSMPFNIIKIDRDFFHSKTTTERERIVISNIVRMASELQMEVICEGVETEEQASFLLSIGCKTAQGYLYAKPMPKEDFDKTYFPA